MSEFLVEIPGPLLWFGSGAVLFCLVGLILLFQEAPISEEEVIVWVLCGPLGPIMLFLLALCFFIMSVVGVMSLLAGVMVWSRRKLGKPQRNETLSPWL